ncbi:hypothetical protein CR205_08070 [Alteribacter lacisalsi]|uniref:YolD-like family protein n=1 Tax=Alteribacter lacisalsi TaxID=2045244 RepID=A0A2W0HEU8_9BACI|nr:YolD-like family protein [Alteribacter lacisalsi]PYZ98530.1 hypothetical protein CR205_08070 [Alteribacter lacisalsi]
MHDRGSIKWTSMMLPEHVEKLKELKKEHQRVSHGEADPQAEEEWDRLIAESFNTGCLLQLSFMNGECANRVRGHVTGVNAEQGMLTVIEAGGVRTSVRFSSVTAVSPYEES